VESKPFRIFGHLFVTPRIRWLFGTVRGSSGIWSRIVISLSNRVKTFDVGVCYTESTMLFSWVYNIMLWENVKIIAK